jgi:predicted O-methyltransferase YrrM
MHVRHKIHGTNNPYENVDLLEEDLQGWASERAVFEEVINQIKPRTIIEVGTWKGRSAVNMANLALNHCDARDLEVICVDTWLGSVEHWTDNAEFKNFMRNGRPRLYDQFLSNVIHRGLQHIITPFPIDSINAYEVFARLGVVADLIYIDAGHDYTSVHNDLYNYSSILRPGGYLIGDDFFHNPVKKAAHDVFGEDKVIPYGEDKFVWIK